MLVVSVLHLPGSPTHTLTVSEAVNIPQLCYSRYDVMVALLQTLFMPSFKSFPKLQAYNLDWVQYEAISAQLCSELHV